MSKKCKICGKEYSMKKEFCPYCLKKEVQSLISQANETKDIPVLLYIALQLTDRKKYSESINILNGIKDFSGDAYAQIAENLLHLDWKNIEKVVEYYETALKMGWVPLYDAHAMAYCIRGHMYSSGIEVEPDFNLAIKSYERAIELGCEEARESLGEVYTDLASIIYKETKNAEQIIGILQKAIALGFEPAVEFLGNVYKQQEKI